MPKNVEPNTAHNAEQSQTPQASQSPSSQSPPCSPSIPLAHDFTDSARQAAPVAASGLALVLQEAITQALLKYSETCKGNAPEQKPPDLDTETPVPTPILSKKALRKERYKALEYNKNDTTPFADKELAKFFEEAYSNGCFHDEIRYYYVPSHIVRYEYKLLRQQEQKDILDMLGKVYNELNLKSKLIAYFDQDKNQELPLAQLSESILQPLQLLHTIYNHLNSLKLVHKSIALRPHKR